MSKDALGLYTNRLAKEETQDVLLALEKLAELPRQEYEPAIPEIGGILALVKTLTIARHNRLDAEKNKRLVRWRCPECKVTMVGFIAPGESLERRCRGIPRNGRTDSNVQGVPICGAQMITVFDEALDAISEPVYEATV